MKIFSALADELDGHGKILGFCGGMEMAISAHMLWMGVLILTDINLQRADVLSALQWLGFSWRVGTFPLISGILSFVGIALMCARKLSGHSYPGPESLTRALGAIMAAIVYTWCSFVFVIVYPRGWLFFILMVTLVISSLRAAWLGGNRA